MQIAVKFEHQQRPKRAEKIKTIMKIKDHSNSDISDCDSVLYNSNSLSKYLLLRKQNEK